MLNKLLTVTIAAFIGILLGTNVALAMAHTALALPSLVPHSASTERDDVPEPPQVATLSEVVITGTVKKPTKSHVVASKHTKVWNCGAPHGMIQGPTGATVRECAWE